MKLGVSIKLTIGLAILILLVLLGFHMLSGDTQNNIARTKIAYIDGDYDVTFAGMTYTKTWHVRDGKVTSAPEKGYYLFWAQCDSNPDKNCYVQSPIGLTAVEEVK